MTAATTRRPLLAGAICVISGLLLMSTAGGAGAAESASPSPSPSPSASPSANPSASASPSSSPSGPASASGSASPSPSPSEDVIGADDLTGGNELSGGNVLTGNNEALTVGIDRYVPYTSTATAVGGNGLATATLPIPAGLVPVVVKGTLTTVADSAGTVRVRVGPSYAEFDVETGGDFEIQVNRAAIVDGTVTVEVRNTLEPGKGECEGDFTTTSTISDLEMGFIGRETPPTTIAGFFSPPVQKVTVVSTDTPDLDSAAATLAAAGAISKRYDRTVPILTVTESEFAADPTSLVDSNGPNRIVRIVNNDADKVTVSVDNPGVPTLTLAGPTPQLADAAAALASAGLGLAAVPVATELSEKRSGAAQETLTLAELGQPKPTLAGIGRLVYSLPLPQDRFGGPVNSVTIHLEGAYTPVAPGGQTMASILWNDQLIQAQQLGADYVYSVDVTVDGSLVRRDNFLALRLDVTAPGGDCGNAVQPMQMDIDGYKSTVSATPGQSVRAGFLRFPQAFGSTMHVAFGSGPLTPAVISDACSLVISLQRASTSQLEITTEAFSSFVTAPYAGLLVGATPEDATALKAPLRYEPWRAVDGAFTQFTVTVDGPFAALQAFEYDGRNILMLGSTAPAEQSAPLTKKLADEAENGEFGWFGLTDSIWVAQPNGPLLFLNTGVLVPQDSVKNEGRQLPPWWILVIGAVILLLLVRWWMLRRRKKRVARRVADADAAAAASGSEASVAIDESPSGPEQDRAPDVT